MCEAKKEERKLAYEDSVGFMEGMKNAIGRILEYSKPSKDYQFKNEINQFRIDIGFHVYKPLNDIIKHHRELIEDYIKNKNKNKEK